MKKIFAVVVAIAMVMALTLSVSAIDGSITVKLYGQNGRTWVTPQSEPVTIDHAGEYTLVLEGDDVNYAPNTDVFKTLYIKDVEAEENGATSSNLSNFTITVKSVKMNDIECTVREGYPTGLNNGVFDCCLINAWVEDGSLTFVDFAEGVTDPITKVEVVFEISDASAEAEAPAAEEAPAETAPAETAEAPETGIALAVVPAVIALAAAVISKRR